MWELWLPITECYKSVARRIFRYFTRDAGSGVYSTCYSDGLHWFCLGYSGDPGIRVWGGGRGGGSDAENTFLLSKGDFPESNFVRGAPGDPGCELGCGATTLQLGVRIPHSHQTPGMYWRHGREREREGGRERWPVLIDCMPPPWALSAFSPVMCVCIIKAAIHYIQWALPCSYLHSISTIQGAIGA